MVDGVSASSFLAWPLPEPMKINQGPRVERLTSNRMSEAR